ncbi:hypothetical protein C7W93_07050 [Glaciimonas sp. PCH181]|nr:hypothetical protein C7W93_07050 [Glaciimonas sp. PCH181]
MHGGLSTGNPSAKGNQSAIKHGFYSDALLDDAERDLYARAEIGSIDDEIRLAKVKLFRYVKASDNVSLLEMVDGALEVIRKQGEDMQGVPYDKRELKAAAPNYADLIIRTLDLIRKLEVARVQIRAAKGQGNEDDSLTREDTFISPDEPIPDEPIL